MKSVILLGWIIAIVGCKSQPGYTVPSLGWKIDIPKEYLIDDSLSYMRRFKTENINPAVLLWVHDSTNWNLTRYEMRAVAALAGASNFNTFCDSARQSHSEFFTNKSIQQTILDSSTGTDKIDRKDFRQESWKLQSGAGIIHYYFYYRVFSNRILIVSIYWNDDDPMGAKLPDILEASTFKE
jgi:hypothetical protein